MRAAVRAKTSSRSSDEFTSSPISASVAKTSAETSVPVFVVCASACAPVGFMDSLYYSRREGHAFHSSAAFADCDRFFLFRNRLARCAWSVAAARKKFAQLLPSFLRSFLLEVASERESTHIGQVPVAFGIVQSVSDDKFVGNREADVVGAHRCDAALGLVQQHRDAQVLRLAMLE